MKEIILIVDDEKEDIKNFRDRLKDLHAEYEVEEEMEFSNTINKITRIREHGDKVVAVFIDICKKESGKITNPGYDTIFAVRQKFDDIFIVAYSQYTRADVIKQAQDKGANWYWEKQEITNLTLGDLKNEIRKHESDQTVSRIAFLKKILGNFSNAIFKITKNRRKGHDHFAINDEYDVQDILYTILKPIFDDLTDEEPSSKTGGKGTRIDFVIPSERIVIETKMIKETDKDESKYIKEIKEIKEDIESYYKYQHVEHFICFVYDPYGKTKDENRFYDLAGNRAIKGIHFEVHIVVQH